MTSVLPEKWPYFIPILAVLAAALSELPNPNSFLDLLSYIATTLKSLDECVRPVHAVPITQQHC